MPILFGNELQVHRPGFDLEVGRLWTPSSSHLPKDVGEGGGAEMVCSPFGKYVFVKPQDEYNAETYIAWRDDNEVIGASTVNSVAGYVFWLGDSSSCGGTIIQQNTSDPMQAFLRDPATKDAFSSQSITRGGFFLIGGLQGPASAASEIKKIMVDLNLDFIVLGLHRTGVGTQPDLPIVALRHLIASIRWDIGAKKPIILMVGDENSNVHLMPESSRGNLFVGDISDQDTEKKQIDLIDRAGYLQLNWWPMMAFVPNSDNGIDVRASMEAMDNRLFHPLLIPQADSGCPFNTNRDLSDAELSSAQSDFELDVILPLTNPTVRTTSVWFWDFESVKNRSRVISWAVPRGKLDGAFANIDYMSDMQVVFESTPNWIAHPVYTMPFAMEFRMTKRSPNTQVIWDRDTHGPGNIPAMHGMKDKREGWLTVVTAFELSPTATAMYTRDVYPTDSRAVPIIPPWAEFSWLREVSQSSLDDPGGGFLGIVGVLGTLLGLLGDALVWLPNRLGIGNQTNNAGFLKWTAGLNQPHVVLFGTPGDPGLEDISPILTTINGLNILELQRAPFSIQIQTFNFKVANIDVETGVDIGWAWPAHVFNIIPISISDTALGAYDPFLTPVGLTAWQDLGWDFSGYGTTPLKFSANVQIVEGFGNIHIPRWEVLRPLLDYKHDFPPMLDRNDPFLARNFSNHLARIDITHPRVFRKREPNFGGGGAGGGISTQGVLTTWPIPDDREILITQGFFGQLLEYCGGSHRALDLIYSDGSASFSTPILAAGPGVVQTVSWCAECGKYIEILHTLPASGNTFLTRYLHLSETAVDEGDPVDAGEIIGIMGDEGTGSTGLHLHFAIWMGSTCFTARNPCDELPVPTNGVTPADCGSTVADLICTLFGDAITLSGLGDTIEDPCGLTVRKVDAALAIARWESTGPACGFNESAQNCFCFVPGGGSQFDLSVAECTALGGTLVSHVGLFQIQNPTHIPDDIAAGNISAASIINNDPECPGIDIAQDYKRAQNNILAAIRISNQGSDFTAWDTWNQCLYRDCLGGGCI